MPSITSGRDQELSELNQHVAGISFLATETYINISPEFPKLAWKALPDFGKGARAIMDDHPVSYSVLSLPGPGVQVEKDAGVACERAKWVNDFLAKEIQKQPRRYDGFAHLAMQNPKEAADELERCLRELKFQGASC